MGGMSERWGGRGKREWERVSLLLSADIFTNMSWGGYRRLCRKRERGRERGGMFEKWNRGGIWEMEGGGCRGWMHRDPGGNSEGV